MFALDNYIHKMTTYIVTPIVYVVVNYVVTTYIIQSEIVVQRGTRRWFYLLMRYNKNKRSKKKNLFLFKTLFSGKSNLEIF